jgi:hypothetical protein
MGIQMKEPAISDGFPLVLPRPDWLPEARLLDHLLLAALAALTLLHSPSLVAESPPCLEANDTVDDKLV